MSRNIRSHFTRWRAAAGEERGASLVEIAFVATFMFILIAGIVDLGGAYQNYVIVINSSREGARLYARLPCTSSNHTSIKPAVVAAVQSEAAKSNVTLAAGNVTLSPDPSGACPASNSVVSVAVQVSYKTLMGKFWGATTFPLRAQTSMMFYGVD